MDAAVAAAAAAAGAVCVTVCSYQSTLSPRWKFNNNILRETGTLISWYTGLWMSHNISVLRWIFNWSWSCSCSVGWLSPLTPLVSRCRDTLRASDLLNPVIFIVRLHVMQRTVLQSLSVRPSVRLSVKRVDYDKTKETSVHVHSYTTRKNIHPSFLTRRMVSGVDPFYLKCWTKLTALG